MEGSYFLYDLRIQLANMKFHDEVWFLCHTFYVCNDVEISVPQCEILLPPSFSITG